MIQRITLPPLEWVMMISRVMPLALMKLVSWVARQPAARLSHMYCSKSQLITV